MSTLNQSGDCQLCEKRCVLCKNYLLKTDKACSHQTNTKYKIKDIIDCNSRNVIYIINHKVCKISSVSYTADNMKTRSTNHKSHIKYNKRLCEVSKHFSDNLILHTLDKSSQLKYNNILKEQIEVIIIEKVDVSEVGTDIESIRKKLKEREWYWQNNLKTLRQYGGLNFREEVEYFPGLILFSFFEVANAFSYLGLHLMILIFPCHLPFIYSIM